MQLEASWRSGYAEDCKSLYGGSIPSEASNKINNLDAASKVSKIHVSASPARTGVEAAQACERVGTEIVPDGPAAIGCPSIGRR